MAQNYDDPVYTTKAAAFVSKRIKFIRGDGLTKVYRLFKSFDGRELKNNRKPMQGQYQTPVAWSEGQQDGPGSGSYILGHASWMDAYINFFKGTPLGSVHDIEILTQENGVNYIEELRGVNNESHREEGASEGGEPLMESVSFGFLEYRLNGMRQYDPAQWTFSLDVQLEMAISLTF